MHDGVLERCQGIMGKAALTSVAKGKGSAVAMTANVDPQKSS
jgi:hypothetical protein